MKNMTVTTTAEAAVQAIAFKALTPSVEGGIACGNHAGENRGEVKHASVAAVRACFLGDTFACYWLVRRDVIIGEDEYGPEYEPRIEDCGQLAWATDRGWACEAGHAHVTAEVRHREGWDYAHDEIEAAQMRAHGVDAVAMNGSSI